MGISCSDFMGYGKDFLLGATEIYGATLVKYGFNL